MNNCISSMLSFLIIIIVYLHRIVLTVPTLISSCSGAPRSIRRLDCLDNRLALFRTQHIVKNIVRGLDNICLNPGFKDKLLAESDAGHADEESVVAASLDINLLSEVDELVEAAQNMMEDADSCVDCLNDQLVHCLLVVAVAVATVFLQTCIGRDGVKLCYLAVQELDEFGNGEAMVGK